MFLTGVRCVQQCMPWSSFGTFLPSCSMLNKSLQDPTYSPCLFSKVQAFVFSGILSISLHTHPNVFITGIHFGFFASKPIDQHVIQPLGEVNKKLSLAVWMAGTVYFYWLQWPRMWIAASLISSFFIASRLGNPEPLSPLDQKPSPSSLQALETVYKATAKSFVILMGIITAHTNATIFWSCFSLGFAAGPLLQTHLIKKVSEAWDRSQRTEEKLILLCSHLYALHTHWSFFWPISAIYTGLYAGTKFRLWAENKENSSKKIPS